VEIVLVLAPPFLKVDVDLAPPFLKVEYI